MLPAEPPTSAANCSAFSMSVPSGSGYRSMPARPTTIAASGRLRSKDNVISDAPPLATATLVPGRAGGEHFRSLADFSGAHFPPGMAALGPRIGIDLDVDDAGAVGALGALEGRLEARHAS